MQQEEIISQRDKQQSFTMLICPLCRENLTIAKHSLQCKHKHAFDIAKQGYVNLLLPQRKKSKEPGDSKEMIISRRQFLEEGFYNPIVESLNQEISSCIPASSISILDIGCGEGFYMTKLKEHLKKEKGSEAALQYFGIDISKIAVNAAAKRDKEIVWLVANSADLPFADSSIQVAIAVFAPIYFASVNRVLQTEGTFITITPASKHLYELRHLLYRQATEHPRSALVSKLQGYFHLLHTSRITYRITLISADDIMNLFRMTPYYWKARTDILSNIQTISSICVTVDVFIDRFVK